MQSGGVVVAVPAEGVVHAVGDVVGVARGEAVFEALAQRSSVVDGARGSDPPTVLSGDVVIVVPNCEDATTVFKVTPLDAYFLSTIPNLVITFTIWVFWLATCVYCGKALKHGWSQKDGSMLIEGKFALKRCQKIYQKLYIMLVLSQRSS